uniref:Variant surface glycoprotein 426 n=1 Tax=Trypanosoma brucei TaxID=5691 RepID=M4TD80_9TRYP|nr:variant surface glycoprotein 426 [Trypanosoma brucei]
MQKTKQVEIKQTFNLATVFAVILSLNDALTTEAAAPNAGDNAAAFEALCLVINAAKQVKLPTPHESKAGDILDYSATINITLNGPEGVADLIANADKEHKNLKNGTLQNKNCGGEKWAFCQRGAKKAKAIKDNAEYKAWVNHPKDTATTKQIQDIVQQEIEVEIELKKQREAAADTSIQEEINKALHGPTGKEEKITVWASNSNRKAACGDTNNNAKGELAGASIAQDALCLCVKDASQTEAAACSKYAADALTVTANGITNALTDWQKLQSACERQRTSDSLAGSDIRSAIRAFAAHIAKPQSTGNKINVLGNLNGAGTGGCDGGAGGTDGGACVYYGTDATGGITNIGWLKLMLQAADKLDNARDAAGRAHALEQHLLSLNKTLATLATGTTAAESNKTDTQPGTKQDKQQETGKQTECEKHTDKTAEQCKSLGCDYDAENKKCKPKAGTENTAAETGDDKTEEKCARKEQKDCKDECKCDSKTLKYFIFLVNNKSTQIAAASMSLVTF